MSFVQGTYAAVALDVRGRDIDIDGDGIFGTLKDREDIAEVAELYANASWTRYTYSDGHVHAQWTRETRNKERASTSDGPFTLPEQSTDEAVLPPDEDEALSKTC